MSALVSFMLITGLELKRSAITKVRGDLAAGCSETYIQNANIRLVMYIKTCHDQSQLNT